MPRGFPPAGRVNEFSRALQPCNFRLGRWDGNERAAAREQPAGLMKALVNVTRQGKLAASWVPPPVKTLPCYTSLRRLDSTQSHSTGQPLLPLTWGVLPQSFVDE